MRMAIRQRVLLNARGTLAAGALALAVTFVPVSAQQAERVDLNAIDQIKDEGFQRSRVMEIASWLTDVYGPRLTNSPGFRKAGDWAVKEMTSWGLVNVKLQPFGPFGRGWANDKFSMMATTPGGSLPVIGYPQAWTSSTNGAVSGDAVFATLDTRRGPRHLEGQAEGEGPPHDRDARGPGALRAAGAALHRRAVARPRARDRFGRPWRTRRTRRVPRSGAAARRASPQTRTQFLKDEGVLAILTPGHGVGRHGVRRRRRLARAERARRRYRG